MRRLVLLGAAAVVSVLGFGAAYVLASSKQSEQLTICHSGNGKHFTEITPSGLGVLEGHVKNDQDDIIPPFFVVEDGTTTQFAGQNMYELYGNGFFGHEVLANQCVIPTGDRPVMTETVVTTVTETTPIEVPGTTVVVPPLTTTKEVTITVTVPEQTVTTPGTTTVITVPAGATSTVTLPTETVTLPAATRTVSGGVVERPPVTVTLAGTTTTVVAGATAAVVTVNGPNKAVREGLLATKRAHVTVTTPKRVIHIGAHAVAATHRFRGKKLIVVVRAAGCPPGTVLYQGHCTGAVRGKG